jgi:hypothetical protein
MHVGEVAKKTGWEKITGCSGCSSFYTPIYFDSIDLYNCNTLYPYPIQFLIHVLG